MLDHVIQDPQHASSTALERDVRERQIALAAADALRDCRALVDRAQPAQREGGGHVRLLRRAASGRSGRLVGKVERLLDRLEARLVAEGVEE